MLVESAYGADPVDHTVLIGTAKSAKFARYADVLGEAFMPQSVHVVSPVIEPLAYVTSMTPCGIMPPHVCTKGGVKWRG